MFVTKVKTVLAVGLTLSLIGAGAGVLAHQARTGPQPAEGEPQEVLRPAVDAADTGLKEGWQESVPVPDPLLGAGDHYEIWVENGWLQVKRQTGAGQVDWHIVLARATDPKPPAIATPKGTLAFEVSYREGRYFIRETMELLRCVRERKRGPKGSWPQAVFSDAEARMGSSVVAGGGATITAWKSEGWSYVASGPSQYQVDCRVRLNTEPEGGGRVHCEGRAGGPQRAFHGDRWLMDDGELLVASRGLEAFIQANRVRAANLAKLVGGPAPALEGKEWHNVAQAPSWEDLRGKVVLLDFWATWCGPCVQKLPEVQALHDRLEGKGLVVLGVHSRRWVDNLGEFLKKHKVTFPVVVDTGKTWESYAISEFPSYLLVDKTGRVVRGASHTVPTQEEIEQLLSK